LSNHLFFVIWCLEFIKLKDSARLKYPVWLFQYICGTRHYRPAAIFESEIFQNCILPQHVQPILDLSKFQHQASFIHFYASQIWLPYLMKYAICLLAI
jgi:hypothetical protein